MSNKEGLEPTKSKFWCFTEFDTRGMEGEFVHPPVKTQRQTIPWTYLVWGLETCPTTGRVHKQGYVEFKDRVTLDQIKRAWGDKVHLEKRWGTAFQAASYCKKEAWDLDDPTQAEWIPNEYVFEEGKISNPEQGRRGDLSDIKTAILKEGAQMLDIIDQVNNHQQLKFAEGLIKYSPVQRNWKMEVRWYWGPSGTGKTRQAWKEAGFETTWCSPKDLQWWDGYGGQENVILDDYRANHTHFTDLLRIFDRYPYRVPVKGAFANFVAKRIWVTSPYHPTKLFTSEAVNENIEQLLRRITVIREFTSEDVDNFSSSESEEESEAVNESSA